MKFNLLRKHDPLQTVFFVGKSLQVSMVLGLTMIVDNFIVQTEFFDNQTSSRGV
jgi:hypothetical protein